MFVLHFVYFYLCFVQILTCIFFLKLVFCSMFFPYITAMVDWALKPIIYL